MNAIILPPQRNLKEREELIKFVSNLPRDMQLRLHVALDQTYFAALDYLDPACMCFIPDKYIRAALVIGCETHIAATYG